MFTNVSITPNTPAVCATSGSFYFPDHSGLHSLQDNFFLQQPKANTRPISLRSTPSLSSFRAGLNTPFQNTICLCIIGHLDLFASIEFHAALCFGIGYSFFFFFFFFFFFLLGYRKIGLNFH